MVNFNSIELISSNPSLGNSSVENKKISLENTVENKNVSSTFSDLLFDKIAESNQSIKTSEESIKGLLVGKEKNLHGTILSIEKADISFRFLMQVRNKMLDAYKEIMRMQI